MGLGNKIAKQTPFIARYVYLINGELTPSKNFLGDRASIERGGISYVVPLDKDIPLSALSEDTTS